MNRTAFIGIAIIAAVLIYYGQKLTRKTMGYLTWDDKTNDIIDTLHPLIRERATKFVNELENKFGIKVRLYYGHRTFDVQKKLYDQGRTPASVAKGEKIVTWAKPGQSYHNYALAFDAVEIKDGKALWNNPNWSTIGEVGKKHGFEWGGLWTKKDLPHFQDRFGRHHTELLAMVNSNTLDDGFVKIT